MDRKQDERARIKEQISAACSAMDEALLLLAVSFGEASCHVGIGDQNSPGLAALSVSLAGGQQGARARPDNSAARALSLCRSRI